MQLVDLTEPYPARPIVSKGRPLGATPLAVSDNSAGFWWRMDLAANMHDI